MTSTAGTALRRKYPHSTASASTAKKLRDLVQPRFSAGSPPDVVFNSGDHALAVGRLVKENHLADLQPVLDAPAWNNEHTTAQDVLLPGMLDAGRYEGSLRAINYLATVYGPGTRRNCSRSTTGTFPAPGPNYLP